jgi:hypothetical protein
MVTSLSPFLPVTRKELYYIVLKPYLIPIAGEYGSVLRILSVLIYGRK